MKKLLTVLLLSLSACAWAESALVCGRTCTVQTEVPIAVTTFVNNFFDSGPTWASPTRFYKDINGTVHLSGVARRYPDGAFGGVMFFLPEGYRPQFDERFSVLAAADGAWLLVKSNGEVWINADASSFVSLSGVTFRAAP